MLAQLLLLSGSVRADHEIYFPMKIDRRTWYAFEAELDKIIVGYKLANKRTSELIADGSLRGKAQGSYHCRTTDDCGDDRSGVCCAYGEMYYPDGSVKDGGQYGVISRCLRGVSPNEWAGWKFQGRDVYTKVNCANKD